MAARSVILILNHVADRHLAELYAQITHDCADTCDVVLLSDRTRPSFAWACRTGRMNEFRFRLQDLVSLGYPGKQDLALPGRLERAMKFGNAELPVLLFHRAHRHYAHYWLVEYDVRFSGDWHYLIAHFDRCEADLLGTTLMRYEQFPSWNRWQSLQLQGVGEAERLRGFFPIYRISNAALECLDAFYRRGCSGHMETLVPTALHHAKLRLEDIGGSGDFVRPENVDRFYVNRPASNDLSPGTFVYRPARTQAGEQPDTLWHPVKPARSIGVRVRNKAMRVLLG